MFGMLGKAVERRWFGKDCIAAWEARQALINDTLREIGFAKLRVKTSKMTEGFDCKYPHDSSQWNSCFVEAIADDNAELQRLIDRYGFERIHHESIDNRIRLPLKDLLIKLDIAEKCVEVEALAMRSVLNGKPKRFR